MAIIEELGLEATILINNEPAPEYPDTEPSVSEQFGPDTKKSHSYVECVDGAEFAIRLEVKSPSSDIEQWLADDDHVIRCAVDVDGRNIPRGYWLSKGNTSRTVEGVIDLTNGLLHKFQFTSVLTVDDSSKSRVARDTELTKNLGEIRLFAWRILRGHRDRTGTHLSQPSFLEGQIAEKALKGKAISHSTTFAAPVTVAPSVNIHSFEWVDKRACPMAVFYFKYRSIEDLQKEMIIPRPRSPSPPAEGGEDDEFANLSKEEIERLARERHAELMRSKRSTTVKREGDDDVPRARHAYKYTRTQSGKEAIDLTEDDD